MSEAFPEAPTETSWLQPSWGKFCIAVIIALGGFFLPQEVPLEWYPLDEPGTDINYLEISCASDVNGAVSIRYDVAKKGNRPIDNITIPISPTDQTFTYTFPLPDAPIVELHVVPPVGGKLSIRQMRIINRRGEEIRRFTRDLFRIEREVDALVPLDEGWKIVATPGGKSPSTRIELFSHIIPVGMNHRNLLRGLLSTGYLAMMLFILLMAVLTATYRPRSWRDFFVHAGFMAGLAFLFSPVGNRGLIRNSIDFARYVPLLPEPGFSLEFDLRISSPRIAQLFWDTGNGLSEEASIRTPFEPHLRQQTLRFPLPSHPLHGLRFDLPDEVASTAVIHGIRVVDRGQNTRALLPLDSLCPERHIARMEQVDDSLRIETEPTARDPVMAFSKEAVARINRVLTAPSVSAK